MWYRLAVHPAWGSESVGECRGDGPSYGVQYEAGHNGVHGRGYADGPIAAGRPMGARVVDHGYFGLQPVVRHVAVFPHTAHRSVKVPLGNHWDKCGATCPCLPPWSWVHVALL